MKVLDRPIKTSGRANFGRWLRPWPRQQSVSIALAIIVLTLASLWIYARSQNFLVCDMECGETVLSVRAANQFAAHGVQFGLLENLGSYDDPQIYTHSVNIGTLTFVALEAVGVHSFALKELLPLAIFGIGLFYVFLTVRFFTRSDLAAIVILIVFATTYWGLGAFAFNALRAWHILAFFGVIYHVAKLRDAESARLHITALTVAACVAFGCGYDFWLPCGSVAVALVLLNRSRSIGRHDIARLGWIAAAFTLPFVLRQFQVIYALGIAYWLQDFIFTIAIKIPHASQIIHIPSIPEIDAFYRAHHVLRPPALPTNDIGQILYTLRHMIVAITVPRWGIVTTLTFVLMLGYSAVLRVPPLYSRFAAPSPVAEGLSNVVLPASLGIAFGLAVFAPFSLHVYFKHEFPLVAFPILVAKGLAVYWLASLVAQIHGQTVSKAIAALLIAAYAGDALMVHMNNTDRGSYANFGWRQFVQDHPRAQFMLSTYRMLDAADPMLGLSYANFNYINPADVLRSSNEIDLGDLANSTSRPTYWIYQPTDHVVDFDAPQPNCRWNDWILGPLKRAISNWVDTPHLTFPWITPSQPGIGTTLSFGGGLKGFNRDRDIVEIKAPAGVSVSHAPIYNCIYSTWIGWATITRVMPQPLTIDIVDVHRDGSKKLLQEYTMPTTDTPNRNQPIGMPASPSLPIAAVIAAFPNYPVVARSDQGIGYVIFEVPKSERPM